MFYRPSNYSYPLEGFCVKLRFGYVCEACNWEPPRPKTASPKVFSQLETPTPKVLLAEPQAPVWLFRVRCVACSLML